VQDPEHPLQLNRLRKNPLNSAVCGAVLMAVIRIRLYIPRLPSVGRAIWAALVRRLRGEGGAVKAG
jgi:hypothetical protein